MGLWSAKSALKRYLLSGPNNRVPFTFFLPYSRVRTIQRLPTFWRPYHQPYVLKAFLGVVIHQNTLLL